MDFARKQLEKYGWSDGKGLGKHENGISQPLKPKLKRSVTGIGHNPASDFTEHWWTNLYNKAASNVEVKEKNGKTKKIKTKDDSFKITNSSYHLNKNDTNEEEYSDFFVKTAVLTNGGSKTERVRESDSDSEDESEKKHVTMMTDEELFAACGGRTAHKGARHGLRAEGKLARIQRQEQMLLSEAKYSGYSHAEKKSHLSVTDLQVVEDINLNSDSEVKQSKKKRKKRKRCFSNEDNFSTVAECSKTLPSDSEKRKDLEGKESREVRFKSKKSKRKSDDGDVFDLDDFPKCKKKRNRKDYASMEKTLFQREEKSKGIELS